MKSATAKELFNSKINNYTQQQVLDSTKTVLRKHGIPKYKLHLVYNETHTTGQMPYSTFYYKLSKGSFSQTELNRLNIVVKDLDKLLSETK